MASDPTPPRRTRVSLRDIAKQLGVSHVTVSLALRDHPRISQKTRERIKAEADQLGYRPDPMLSALANYRRNKSSAPISSSIAWINAWRKPDELRAHREFDAYWRGASRAAEKFGYRLDEFRVGKECSPKRLHDILTARGIRGLLLPPQYPLPDWGDFPWKEYATVRFGRSLATPRTHLVTSDQSANTMLAFEEMRARGYRRIGFVTDEANMRRGHVFEAGFLLAQRTVDPVERVEILSLEHIPAKDQPDRIVAWIRGEKVDALFTDLPDIPDLLAKAGLEVPANIPLAVTSVLDARADAGIDQHPEEIGRVGFLMLNSLINDRAQGIPRIFRQILVEGSWVDGKSLPRK
ncbi:DNA-binding LacI/PurR family transcriptional regulator [Haloferula luteola]|uniref:DNA-binding LacI/PurR family transcriptional regulator n=1 Tax=Haloferula luteola TaxID=595692 RepID=A0A840VD65_9BACT|nr:LacI family DNA-binding transcriptional regulator [Haloferula luteola]MBB5353454.1 DNA-binding LacI/PurR family transcriptional regulator [Haloferula luteola]